MKYIIFLITGKLFRINEKKYAHTKLSYYLKLSFKLVPNKRIY